MILNLQRISPLGKVGGSEKANSYQFLLEIAVPLRPLFVNQTTGPAGNSSGSSPSADDLVFTCVWHEGSELHRLGRYQLFAERVNLQRMTIVGFSSAVVVRLWPR